MKKTVTVTTDLLETHLNLEITEKSFTLKGMMTSMGRSAAIDYSFLFFFFKLGPRLLREFVNSRLLLLLVQWSEVDFFSVVIFNILCCLCVCSNVSDSIHPPP